MIYSKILTVQLATVDEIKELSNKYKNISRNIIELFLSLCEPCQQKQKGIIKGIVFKAMVFTKFNSRFRVDLIDFQSHPDGEYRFVMVYQDKIRDLKTFRIQTRPN